MSVSSLWIFGSIHADRLSKVKSELLEYTTDMDALFVEQPDPEIGWDKKAYIQCLVRTPLFFSGLLFIFNIFYSVYLVCNRAPRSTEAQALREIQEKNDIDVYNVDAHPIQLMANTQWPWILVNWILLVAMTVFWGVSLFFVVMVAMIGWLFHLYIYSVSHRLWIGLGIFISVGVYLPFVIGTFPIFPVYVFLIVYILTSRMTMSQREQHIVSRIESLSSQPNIENGCLIIGYQHIDNIKSLIESTDIAVVHVFSSSWLRETSTDE